MNEWNLKPIFNIALFPSRCYLNGKISAIFVHVRLRSNAMLIKELHLSRLQDLKMAVNHMHG